MAMTASLLHILKFSCFNCGTGSKIITRSSKMLNPAPAATTALELIHLPFLVISQTALTGIHCRVIEIENAIVWRTIKAIAIFVTSRKRSSGNIRRKRRRIEILARGWATT